MADLPRTIIVVHPKERRSKCTVEPLRSRNEFLFWKYPRRDDALLANSVRLGLGGEPLTVRDRDRGLLLLDGTWRLAERMAEDFTQLPVRGLLAWRTAYPRRSKLFEDPEAGLATVEALFAAYTQLGRSTDGLLDSYRWRDKFLALNADLIQRCAGGLRRENLPE